jgi:hypothetical protein
VYQNNQGESAARNNGLALAHGSYIALLDSDDAWLPAKLAQQVALLDARPEVGAVFCQAWIIDGQGRRIADQPLGAGLTDRDLTLERLCLDNDLSGPSTSMIRRRVFDQIGGFDPQIRYGEDWDLWLRIAAHTLMAMIPEPLTYLRRHHGAQSYYPTADKNAQRLRDHLTVIEKTFAQWPGHPPSGLRETALARRYLQAFLAEIAVDNVETARDDLQAVQLLKPGALRDTTAFGQWIVDYAAMIAEDADLTGFERAGDFVQRIFQQLETSGARDAHFESMVRGQVCATLGFMAHQHQHTELTRRYLWQAIRRDRRWLRNRGVMSLMAESLAGKSFMQSMRRMTGRASQTGTTL